MMRVLMVSDVYFPRINGVSTSMETFRRALAGEGVEVVVATCTGGERGSILNPAMDRPDVLANMAEIRRAEMDRAREIFLAAGADGVLDTLDQLPQWLENGQV